MTCLFDPRDVQAGSTIETLRSETSSNARHYLGWNPDCFSMIFKVPIDLSERQSQISAEASALRTASGSRAITVRYSRTDREPPCSQSRSGVKADAKLKTEGPLRRLQQCFQGGLEGSLQDQDYLPTIAAYFPDQVGHVTEHYSRA